MQTINATDGIRIIATHDTAGLLAKVLWITTVGFLFTGLGAYIAPDVLSGIGYGALMLVTLGLVFGVNFAARRSAGLGLVLFYALTVLMGIEIGPLLKAYVHMDGGISVVTNAALTTAAGMAVMAMVAQVVRFNYQKAYSYVFAALVGLIILGVLSMFVHFVSPTLYSWLTLIIFSALLLFDFMRIRDAGRIRGTADGALAVQMSLSIYLDALNIFLALLEIFGNGNGRRRSGGWS
jgi:FtsH-binding integral membrane protein